MFNETIDAVAEVAERKANFLRDSLVKYLISSMFAGFLVGVGVILTFSIGGSLTPYGSPYVKLLMGATFAVALSLVVFTGSELFTGNNMIMTVGCINKTVSVLDLVKIWLASYIGNLLGAVFLSFLFTQTGLVDNGPVAEFFQSIAFAKANAGFEHLFFRGVMCNVLVCLAVLITFRTKDDTAKLIIIFLCLLSFVTSGFEHSIANMSVYGIALMSSGVDGISFNQAFANLIPVTLGNIVGGMLLVGCGYSALRSSRRL